ncbi:hypothetical protein GCM10017044_05020 [Kordiimonas sediminis]|uniref:ATP-binding protein n=1 Tax=Kordiimonas sediminis TaxID=1735581 RepID=A0A919AMF8_9PROT|nr:hypothetical protein [Kordiimonas sediminis]GHF13926.1 hypothetical protein GCM10017044_05020 [Kordiimonas sediminis]
MIKADKIITAVKDQVKSAGPRYTPQVEQGAPNIQIENLLKPLASLSFDNGFRKEITIIKEELSKEVKNQSRQVSRLFAKRVRTPSVLVGLLEELTVTSLDQVSKTLKNTEIVASQCKRTLSKASANIWDEINQIRTNSTGEDELASHLDKKKQSLKYADQEIRKLHSCVDKVVDYLGSSSRQLLENNICFIEGGWGTGKTHTLCDLALSKLEGKRPVFFALGKNINGPNIITAGILDGLDNKALFEYLNEAGRKIGERSLVIIDGINEGDKEEWYNEISSLLTLASNYPFVGLVLSVRSPFQSLCVPEAIYLAHTKLTHYGFAENEFDAQKEFFHFYNLNLPEVPILRDEFSRPLMLKIVCEQLSNLTTKKARKNFLGITSGQVGMTYIFEGFVKKVGRRLEDEHGLSRNFCWNIIKELKVNPTTTVGIAKSMAEKSTDYILHTEALDLLMSSEGFQSRQAAKDFLRNMLNEGLLIDGIRYLDHGEPDSREEIIQLPYQKFSDHIISRWLLKNHLDTSSEDTIRRCFYGNKPLGKIFNFDSNSWEKEYAEPGLAEALMIEFPTRLSGEKYDNKRELIFYLPKDKRLISSSVTPFLEGLYWRHPSGIGLDTNSIIRQLLGTKDQEIIDNTLDALMVLALKPNHPLGSKKFSDYLADMSMPDRDLYWGEYLRKLYKEQSPWRLIEWVTKAECINIPADYVPGLLRVLSWLLVTVDRQLRDLATKALALIGAAFPREIYKCCLRLLTTNDPYVSERLLAACYGVTMLKWHGSDERYKSDLSVFARLLYKKIFREDAKHSTNHVLVRDYALGIIALAHKIGPFQFTSAEIENMEPPFPTISNIFPDPEEIQQETCDYVKPAIHMDFGNYTIGRLIEGRANYDSNHQEYQDVLKQIEWRIADLGYDTDRFEPLERREVFGRQGGEASKIDRYGKKYSWIAFFEMVGLRQAHGKLPEFRQNERTSDCDIDPTFILPPEQADIPLPVIYSEEMKIETWLAEYEYPDLTKYLSVNQADQKWIIIDAHLKSDCETDDRSFWLDVKAFIVEDKYLETFIESFSPEIRLDEFTSPAEFYYTYFGETPWRESASESWFAPCKEPTEEQHFTKHQYITDEEAEPILHSGLMVNGQVLIEDEYRKPGEWVTSGGVNCISMVSHYTWESYHSICNDVSGIPFLNTRIADQLNLGIRSRSPDLYDAKGCPAVKMRKIDLFSKYPSSKYLLLRKDIADKLIEEDKSIVLLVAGMKEIKMDSSYKRDEYDYTSYPSHICDIINENRNQVRHLYRYKNGAISDLAKTDDGFQQ